MIELNSPAEIGPQEGYSLEGRRLDAELHARLYNIGVYGFFSEHEKEWRLHLRNENGRLCAGGVVLKYHQTRSDAFEAFDIVCNLGINAKRLAVLYLYCKVAGVPFSDAKEIWSDYSTNNKTFSPEALHSLIFPPAEALSQAALSALIHLAQAKKRQPALIEEGASVDAG